MKQTTRSTIIQIKMAARQMQLNLDLALSVDRISERDDDLVTLAIQIEELEEQCEQLLNKGDL